MKNIIIFILIVGGLSLSVFYFTNIKKDSQIQQEYIYPTTFPTSTIVPTESPKYTTIYLSTINATRDCLLVGVDAVKTADTSYQNSVIEYNNCLDRKDDDYDECADFCKGLNPGASILDASNVMFYANAITKCYEECRSDGSRSISICAERRTNAFEGLENVINQFCR